MLELKILNGKINYRSFYGYQALTLFCFLYQALTEKINMDYNLLNRLNLKHY
ncbi:hypothetical protein VIBNISO65_1370074 [Vibrio nigripulchritudo SO65]|nr:hypothetical protein VIBNISO65_1370074 [Vibrio nigripulchritudo SO65]